MTTGRPKASSRETLAEAACELFLERGYEATTVADITRRAGVSRSSFFNYFSSKGDVVWSAFDERMAAAAKALDGDAPPDEVLAEFVRGFAPESLALAIGHAEAMGLVEELERERAIRHARLAAVLAARARRGGEDALSADVRAGARASALLAAVWSWAQRDPGRRALGDAYEAARHALSGEGSVRQLRVVARTEDFEEALAFYRDVLGMPQAEAYQAEGGARVVILDAGRATLELANPAQVAFIDRVESGPDAPSDPIRLGLEVADSDDALARAAAAGARVEAPVRETPWRSRNGRLRAPGGLQLTLFQEPGAHREPE